MTANVHIEKQLVNYSKEKQRLISDHYLQQNVKKTFQILEFVLSHPLNWHTLLRLTPRY